MKQSRAFVAQRRNELERILDENGRVTISDLSQMLSVSPLTIRRDLDFLEGQGVVRRRYGEAISLRNGEAGEQGNEGPSWTERAKEAIATYAARLIDPADSVFVNTSSTALLVIERTTAQDVTFITNSMKASALKTSPSTTMLVTGGEVRSPRGVLSGSFALSNIRSVSTNRCYVGCAGISPAAGATSDTLQEESVNSLMMERSDFCALLADSSKFGKEAGFTYAQVTQIDLLVTDIRASDEDVEALMEAGLPAVVRIDPDDESTWVPQDT